MRWIRFNVIGVLGFLVQATILALLVHGAGLPSALAVALAVLVTVSHNFVWHERYTWSDRPRGHRFRRWLAFNLSTGVLSVAANVGLTVPLVLLTGLPVVVANLLVVTVLSAANFAVSDRIVFR